MKTHITILCILAVIFCLPASSRAGNLQTNLLFNGYDTIKICTQNFLGYPTQGPTSRDPYFRTIYAAMQPDVLFTEEIQYSGLPQGGPGVIDEIRDSILNYYHPGLYAHAPWKQPQTLTSDTQPAMFYKSSKITYISLHSIYTGTRGGDRDILEYNFTINTTADTLHVFVVHLKADSGSDNSNPPILNSTRRLYEADSLRNFMNTLPAGSKFLVVGDFNTYSNEPCVATALVGSQTNNNGQCKDPLNPGNNPQTWHQQIAYANIHTQSTRIIALPDSGSTAGLDDRFDLILTSASSMDTNIILSSYKAFGNDGNHYRDSINHLPNTAVPDSVANALYHASDHLPVVCSFQFGVVALPASFAQLTPANGSAAQPLSGKLVWNSSLGTNTFDLYFGTSNPPTTIVSANQTDTTYSYSGLPAGTTYYWQVVAKNLGGNVSGTGSPYSFTTAFVPGAFALESPGSGAVQQLLSDTLRWDSASSAASYDVYIDTHNPPVVKYDSNIVTNSYAVSGLHLGTTYYWKIIAKSFAGTTTASNAPFSFSTVNTPAAPTSISISNITTTSMIVHWTDTATNANGYRAYRSAASSGPFVQDGSDLPANATQFSDTGLSISTRYYYRVLGFNTFGEGPSAAINMSTLAVPPGTPAVTQVVGVTVKIVFDSVMNSPSTQYAIQAVRDSTVRYVQSNGGLDTNVQWNSYAQLGSTGGFIVHNLFPCAQYWFKVKARNSDNVETAPGGSDTLQLTCTSFSGNVNAGWNLLSVPILMPAYLRSLLYPTSISNAFSYNHSYVATNTLSEGPGYWLKFASPSPVTFIGDSVWTDTINVVQGWNIIGSISFPVAVNSVIFVPFDPFNHSQFFGYNGSGYTIASTLYPGDGYWVKVGQAGQLILNANGPHALPKLPPPESASAMSSFTFEDSSGHAQTLYIDENPSTKKSGIQYELPPAPPESAFDVRFTAGTYVSSLIGNADGQEFPVALQSLSYPVKLSWSLAGTKMNYAVEINGSEQRLEGSGTLTIDKGTISLRSVAAGHSLVPKSFALYQNYPNPFNPSTEIRYDLPERSRVEITIFNDLGVTVATPVSNVQNAGEYRITWEPAVASGVYFYRIQATGSEHPSTTFQKVLKAIIVK